MDFIFLVICISALYGNVSINVLAWTGIAYVIVDTILELVRYVKQQKDLERLANIIKKYNLPFNGGGK